MDFVIKWQISCSDRTIWDRKVEAIFEYEKYETLSVDKLFSKLKSVEVDRGVTARIESLTDSHSLALVGGSGAKSNSNPLIRTPRVHLH
jgi:uncharacterized protein YllA (UPF0747 family)